LAAHLAVTTGSATNSNSFPSAVVNFDRLLGIVDKHLMLTQLVHTKYNINAL
jgi:hypothetical protein